MHSITQMNAEFPTGTRRRRGKAAFPSASPSRLANPISPSGLKDGATEPEAGKNQGLENSNTVYRRDEGNQGLRQKNGDKRFLQDTGCAD